MAFTFRPSNAAHPEAYAACRESAQEANLLARYTHEASFFFVAQFGQHEWLAFDADIAVCAIYGIRFSAIFLALDLVKAEAVIAKKP
jgi:hypothetical protein